MSSNNYSVCTRCGKCVNGFDMKDGCNKHMLHDGCYHKKKSGKISCYICKDQRVINRKRKHIKTIISELDEEIEKNPKIRKLIDIYEEIHESSKDYDTTSDTESSSEEEDEEDKVKNQ